MSDTGAWDYVGPRWPAAAGARAVTTTRAGGLDLGPCATLELGRPRTPASRAEANRRRLRRALSLPGDPVWLRQVHGARCVRLEGNESPDTLEADAAWTDRPGVVCAVLTADCLPVVLRSRDCRAIGVAHAGWRGLASGVLEALAEGMPVAAVELEAWLGPAIGPAAFEVGPEVRAAFVDADSGAAAAFLPGTGDRWHADLYALARRRLQWLGVTTVRGGGYCTYRESDRFFSHRRDGAATGRMGTLAWLAIRSCAATKPGTTK